MPELTGGEAGLIDAISGSQNVKNIYKAAANYQDVLALKIEVA
jgi:hypothetical protein